MSPTTAPSSADRCARAALTRLLEPGDGLGMLAVRCWGAARALRVLSGADTPEPGERQDLMVAAADLGHRVTSAAWTAAQDRWSSRRADLAPERDLETIHRLGGRLLIPGDPDWPESVDDLDLQAPLALWCRGSSTIPAASRTVAVVGSREATHYGQQVTGQMVSGLARRGLTVLSGGAYGIDAAAHRAALAVSAAEPPTLAVMAGGLDRYYPSGNEELLRQVLETGLLISEMPPGASPTRYRFLSRNRLIAALAGVVVVVEARWRSGAQNTAGHALTLGREVGVVPGPVNSASSAGCHRLLRETPSTLVTEAEDVLALMPGQGLRDDGPSPSGGRPGAAPAGEGSRAHDHLTVEELLVFEALPVRATADVARICSVAGLGTGTVLGVLTRLDRQGLAEQRAAGWRRGSLGR